MKGANIINDVMKIPNITLELIENYKDNPSILEESNVLTQYVIAKCLTRGFSDEHQLKKYINELVYVVKSFGTVWYEN